MLSHRRATTAILIAALVLTACSQRKGRGSGGEPEASSQATAQAPQGAAPESGQRPSSESARKPSQPRTYYQYVDDQGSVRFVESLDAVPAAWRDRVGQVTLTSSPTGSGSPSALQPRPARRVGQRGMRQRFDAEVRLYYAEWCPYCRKAKAHLDRRGVPYSLLDIDIASVKRELIEKTGRRSIPYIEIGEKNMRGYSEERLDQLLSEADLI